MKITAGTIARTIVLVLALVNQVLMSLGYSIIPIEDATVNQIVTLLFTSAAALIAWWKNNSFTSAAIAADEYMKNSKADTNESVNESSDVTDETPDDDE